MNSEDYCKYSPLYRDADSSFLVNFGSKNLRPIRISLPSPPDAHFIDGFGLHPDDQVFKRLEIPPKLVELQKKILSDHRTTSKTSYGTDILKDFWDEIEMHRDTYADEILFIKRYIWFANYGYWIFIDGKPTFIPPWYFTYLNMHRMTTDNGYQYPEYRKKELYRFLFRYYLHNTTETFLDYDEKTGIACKVLDENGNKVYRMTDVGRTLFVGSIEPKGRREGLTNQAVHIMMRIITGERGADKLATIVSMDGDNASTHYMQKLVPSWKSWPMWMKPVWEGKESSGKIIFSSSTETDIDPLDCRVDYTDSAGDMANDGKMLVAALFDEQGKGKRTGNVQERWNINKQAMTLAGGGKVIGFSIHPSTVEKMTEGGSDYKIMCDLSNFYSRGADGQTNSGLAVMFFSSDWCMEEYIDAWGEPVLERPTPRQIQAGYKHNIGSVMYIRNKRKFLTDESDVAKTEKLKSEVRKFPIDYDECWTGISGQLGLDNEKLRARIIELQNKSKSKRGNFEWINRPDLASGRGSFNVQFKERSDGRWIISYEMPQGQANQMSSMEDYSAFEDEDIVVNRPANPKFIVGVDPSQFSNKSESSYLAGKRTKKSDTGIAVLRKRDKQVDLSGDPKDWATKQIVAFMRARLASSYEAAEEALKAAIYYGGLIHPETNVAVVWERIVEWRMGGYLNYGVDVLANGEMKRSNKPGTHLGNNKKDGFEYLANFITFHSKIQNIKEWMEEADEISSMEQLTNFDGLAAVIECLFGDQSMYADIMGNNFGEAEEVYSLGAKTYKYR